ncbi:sensor histidine kinase [Hymenobacter properus]|uniref:histidine kinase n=1 Tax=Hymenobacter properus TaxID=2791026 RepID=A0A931BF91_9BACT|nr:HAMP domain-containing sensor histidine kinase [Hymenobacter properus]MBF9141441.1 HAMP domain-containing histidine kinase [Hymenobacter properus]MBR7720250.1 HAMP domain-containing histidine kinase [Microvirga sp. SRT04]
MKLSTKFSLFNALSRVAILLLLVVGLPPVMSRLALLATDQRLVQKKEKVLRLIRRTGISAFIAGEQSSYGSYNLLKEEFISLETIVPGPKIDVIEDSKRAVEDEIVPYRVLSYSFAQNGQNYLLEIGRSTDSIGETERNFRRYAFYLLLLGVALTTLADLAFFRYLLAPFYTIIRQRLRNSHYPPAFDFDPVETSTDDFRYLDESLREMMATIQASFSKERKFIADASHELLTPLAALQYRFDNMLADESLSEENQLRVVESQRTVHRLRTIIKSLLMISKIENDQFTRTDSVRLQELTAEVSEEVQDRLAVRNLTLTCLVEPDFVVERCNRGLLFTLLFNLVSNAIKYNRENGQVYLLGRPDPTGRGYVLEVRDTGQGIAKEQLPHLFHRFDKGAAADADSYGLGLSIARTIADLHDIAIEVNSIEGLGTSFLLTFPPTPAARR